MSFHQQNGGLHCIEKWENILIIYFACPTAHDTEKLEKVLLSAARIVTGLPIFASKESLYTETGWQTLQNKSLIHI